MRWALVALLAACGSHPATPAAPPSPPPAHPREPTPESGPVTDPRLDPPPAIAFCVADHAEVFADGDKAVVCSEDLCVGYREGEDRTFGGHRPASDMWWPAMIGADGKDACAIDDPDRCRAVAALDATHFLVAASCGHTVSVIDEATGKVTGDARAPGRRAAAGSRAHRRPHGRSAVERDRAGADPRARRSAASARQDGHDPGVSRALRPLPTISVS